MSFSAKASIGSANLFSQDHSGYPARVIKSIGFGSSSANNKAVSVHTTVSSSSSSFTDNKLDEGNVLFGSSIFNEVVEPPKTKYWRPGT